MLINKKDTFKKIFKFLNKKDEKKIISKNNESEVSN